MPLFTAGRASSTEASKRFGRAMRRVAGDLAALPFPTTLERVLDAVGDAEFPVSARRSVEVRDLLLGASAREFSSPDHVAEVVRLAAAFPTDLHPPEGSG